MNVVTKIFRHLIFIPILLIVFWLIHLSFLYLFIIFLSSYEYLGGFWFVIVFLIIGGVVLQLYNLLVGGLVLLTSVINPNRKFSAFVFTILSIIEFLYFSFKIVWKEPSHGSLMIIVIQLGMTGIALNLVLTIISSTRMSIEN